MKPRQTKVVTSIKGNAWSSGELKLRRKRSLQLTQRYIFDRYGKKNRLNVKSLISKFKSVRAAFVEFF